MKTKEHEASNYVYDRLSIDNECYHCLIAEEMFLAGMSLAEQWIDINDKLPETNEQVIVKFENSEGCWYGISNYVKQNKKWDNFSPSHWRPINRK